MYTDIENKLSNTNPKNKGNKKKPTLGPNKASELTKTAEVTR